MPLADGPLPMILASVVILLLLLAVILLLSMRGRLKRIESALTTNANGPERLEKVARGVEGGKGGAFDEFLAEDPERRQLPKSEQFTAFRQWRKDKGLNWSDS